MENKAVFVEKISRLHVHGDSSFFCSHAPKWIKNHFGNHFWFAFAMNVRQFLFCVCLRRRANEKIESCVFLFLLFSFGHSDKQCAKLLPNKRVDSEFIECLWLRQRRMARRVRKWRPMPINRLKNNDNMIRCRYLYLYQWKNLWRATAFHANKCRSNHL